MRSCYMRHKSAEHHSRRGIQRCRNGALEILSHGPSYRALLEHIGPANHTAAGRAIDEEAAKGTPRKTTKNHLEGQVQLAKATANRRTSVAAPLGERSHLAKAYAWSRTRDSRRGGRYSVKSCCRSTKRELPAPKQRRNREEDTPPYSHTHTPPYSHTHTSPLSPHTQTLTLPQHQAKPSTKHRHMHKQ